MPGGPDDAAMLRRVERGGTSTSQARAGTACHAMAPWTRVEDGDELAPALIGLAVAGDRPGRARAQPPRRPRTTRGVEDAQAQRSVVFDQRRLRSERQHSP